MKTETGGRLLYLQITNYRPRKLPPDILSLLLGGTPADFPRQTHRVSRSLDRLSTSPFLLRRVI